MSSPRHAICDECQHRWLCMDRVMARRSSICEINADTEALEKRDAALLAYIASGRYGRTYKEIREHFGWNHYSANSSTTLLRSAGKVVSMGKVGRGPRYGTPEQAERAAWVYEKKRNFRRWLVRRNGKQSQPNEA